MKNHKARKIEFARQENSYRAWMKFCEAISEVEKLVTKTRRNDGFDSDGYANNLNSYKQRILNSWDKSIRKNTTHRKVLDNLFSNLTLHGDDCAEDITNTRLCCLKKLKIK